MIRFLFIAPRFHTNQYPISKYLRENGNVVNYLVCRIGPNEDHSIIKPDLIRPSLINKILNTFLKNRFNSSTVENKLITYFVPNLIYLYDQIKKINPDVVILRDNTPLSYMSFWLCKLIGIRGVVLYNQRPLYNFKNKFRLKNTLKKIIGDCFGPKVVITPVLTNSYFKYNDRKEKREKREKNRHRYFVNFVGEQNLSIRNRKYCKNGYINILDVGKYRDYKNHFILVDAIEHVSKKNKLRVTVLGQVVTIEERNYFNRLDEYIKTKKLQNVIKLYENVAYSEMKDIYLKNDLFILPSKNELASVSIIESMANGLATISTSSNGTATYIDEGNSGYIFKSQDPRDLANKIERIIENEDNIAKMGQTGYKLICEKYSGSNYMEKLNTVLKNEFRIDSIRL